MMSQTSSLIDVTVSRDGTYIIARMLGEHTIDMAKTASAILREFVASTGLTKILVRAPDQRKMFGTLPTVEFGTALEPLAVSRQQFAIVVRMKLAEVRFTETVMTNRHITLRYFNDESQALAWLGVAPDPEDDR